MTFYEWMSAALYDPTDGYYCRADKQRWGREGDYRTSPERSSLFAATFARYFVKLHERLGSPVEWTIVEVGAGAGDFAHGVLKTLQRQFPAVYSATHYVVDELSRAAQAIARQRLQPFSDRVVFRKLTESPVKLGIVFSNELLDAFPVHRVTLDQGRLLELYVVPHRGEFHWGLGPLSNPGWLKAFVEDSGINLVEGQVIDVNLDIERWLTDVLAFLHTGFHIAVDYGEEPPELYDPRKRPKGTLRAIYQHRVGENVLERPGEQDLTTTVDWEYVRRTGKRKFLDVFEFQRQDKFLLTAGLLEQLELESQGISAESERMRLTTAAREMILPDGMAANFQVLVQSKNL